jgi:hypothetical protein
MFDNPTGVSEPLGISELELGFIKENISHQCNKGTV